MINVGVHPLQRRMALIERPSLLFFQKWNTKQIQPTIVDHIHEGVRILLRLFVYGAANDNHSLVTHHRRNRRAGVSMFLFIGLALLFLLPKLLHSTRENSLLSAVALTVLFPATTGTLGVLPWNLRRHFADRPFAH